MRYLQRQKPPLGARIDWSHPLSRGLIGCWLFNEKTGDVINELVYQETYSKPDNITWTFDSGLHGYSPNGINLLDKQRWYLTKFTFHVILRSDTDMDGSRVEQPVWNADRQFQYAWNHSNPDFVNSVSFKSGSTWYPAKADETLLKGRIYSITGFYDGKELGIAIDGVVKNRVVAPMPNENDGSLCLINRNDGVDVNWSGTIFYFVLHNRALSAEEIRWLHQDPYCFIKTPMQWYDKIVSVVYASSTVSDAYKILTYLEKLLSDQYSILNFISTQQPDIYKILNYTSNFITDSYQLLNFTAKLQSDAYTLFNYTSQTTIDVYTIYNFASNLIQDIYSITGLITKTLSDLYSILQYSSQTTTDTYSIFNFAQQTSSDTYTIYNYAKQQIQDLYNILNYAGSELRDIYNILQTLEKLLDDSYSIYNFAKQFVNDEYKIYNYAAGKIADYYSILVEQIVREVIVLKSEITREITRKSRILRDIILRSRLI